MLPVSVPGAGWRNAFLVTAAALAASIGIHLLPDESLPAKIPSCPECPECPPAPPVAAAPSGSADAVCQADLAQCRQEAWSLVARALRPSAPVPAPVASMEAPDAGPPPKADTSPAGQRRAFCALAEQQVRNAVLQNKELVQAGLAVIGTPQWVENELPYTMDRVKNTLGLNEARS
jgi:hypothetical protein